MDLSSSGYTKWKVDCFIKELEKNEKYPSEELDYESI